MTDGRRKNLADLVFSNARRFPNRTALKTLGQDISYSGLRKLILAFALHLKKRGIGQFSCVLIDTNDPLVAIASTLGLSMLGGKWVQATKAAVDNRKLHSTHMLSDGKSGDRSGPNVIVVDKDWSVVPREFSDRNMLQFEGYASPNDIWMIAQSSGTTGSPRFMAITEANALARSDTGLLLDPNPHPVATSFLHPLHPGNMFNILRVLAKGGTFLFGQDLPFWTRNNVSFVIGSPVQFSAFLRIQTEPFIKKIPLAWLGGGPIYPSLVNSMLRLFDGVTNTYGAVEAGIICSNTTRAPLGEIDRIFLGAPHLRTSLQVVDQQGNLLSFGMEGNIRLKSPWQVQAYIGDDVATKNTFKQGWFYPGDIGYLDKAGGLCVTGREHDQFNLGGMILNSSLIDEILQSHPGIMDGICFAERGPNGIDELSAVLVISGEADLDKMISGITARIQDAHGPSKVPVRFYAAETIPRNDNGKALRANARDLAANGAWRAVSVSALAR